LCYIKANGRSGSGLAISVHATESTLMKRRFKLVSQLVIYLIYCQAAVARSDAIAAFESAQGKLKISFIECAMQLRIYNLSIDKRKKAKSLENAANCMAGLQASIQAVAKQYKTTNNDAEAVIAVDDWKNKFTAITELAIKYQGAESMPSDLLDIINESNAETVVKMRRIAARQSYLNREREMDKVTSPVNPDFEPVTQK
jgi:hypothetical protein